MPPTGTPAKPTAKPDQMYLGQLAEHSHAGSPQASYPNHATPPSRPLPIYRYQGDLFAEGLGGWGKKKPSA